MTETLKPADTGKPAAITFLKELYPSGDLEGELARGAVVILCLDKFLKQIREAAMTKPHPMHSL